MMSEETYRKMKKLCHMYETQSFLPPGPYIVEYTIEETHSWNKDYDQDALCKCGHTYYRHFDTYEEMDSIGCKYCGCYEFEPQSSQMLQDITDFMDNLSDEELNETFSKYGPAEEEPLPQGWVSIEDALPVWIAGDLMEGGTQYKVRYVDGREDFTYVKDHDLWYYYAKEAGITHWLNEKIKL